MASSDERTSLGSNYQVFLSFRGPDTRVGFTDVLFHSLNDTGICVFRDDEEVRVGERIDGSLQRAIDNSRIYIPVFSRTYASSQWCLRELVQILANTSKSEGKKEILPIFYDVQPDDVKLKTPLYHDAILNLEREKKLSTEQVDVWRKALMEVDAIKGWEVKKYKGYVDVIKLVVEEVLKKLKIKHRSVTENLVGIGDRVVAVNELLDIDSGGVRLIGIYGMGGIGKNDSCQGARSIDEIDYGTQRTEEALDNKKVLIVLDDVANSKQVEELVGRSSLYQGSRILITTRNKDVFRISRPKYQILEYEMEVMSSDHALELFSRHAFNKDFPSYDYKELSREIVSATGRLPLAIEVIGSFLFDRSQQIWKETLDKLSKAPHEDVFGKLKISYDALTFEQKQIFLDIACFFIGEPMMCAIYMWKDCDFFPDTGLDVLVSMSLVKIVKNAFWMHDQLRDLGREIVRQENPINPGERSRIWIDKEVLDAIRTKEMKKNVQALDLYLGDKPMVAIKSEEIGRFERLRYLKLNSGTFSGNLANSLTNLSWMVWKNPPHLFFKPANICLKNVVILEYSNGACIGNSKLQSLVKMAGKLKVLSLKGCRNINRMPDFSGCPNLERLIIESCNNLRKIGGSIGKLESLIDLMIRSCRSLEDLPKEIENLVNLKHFSIEKCPLLTQLPDSVWKLKSLRELHFDIGLNSWALPSHIMPPNLEVLRISSWGLKGRLPSAIGSLPNLRILCLTGTCISEVPETINLLPCLQTLELMGCDEIQELPTLPTSLKNLKVSSNSLWVVPDLSNLTNLVELYLSDDSGKRQGGKIYTSDLGWIRKLSKLNQLTLRLLNVPAPSELTSLSQLLELDLSNMDFRPLTRLPPSLLNLGLRDLNSTISLSSKLENLSRLNLFQCRVQEIQLNGLILQNLSRLCLFRGESLERFGLSNMRKLKSVSIQSFPKLVEIQFAGLFESLEEIFIVSCESLGRLAYAGEVESANELIIEEGTLILLSRVIYKLRLFLLVGCPKILQVQVLGVSELWHSFDVIDCDYLQSVRGLSHLKKLKSLEIKHCNELQVVEGLDELEFLRRLEIHHCPQLKGSINVSNTKLPDDCRIYIRHYQKGCGANENFVGSVHSYKNYKVGLNLLLSLFLLFSSPYFSMDGNAGLILLLFAYSHLYVA
ncbi:disease resistance protein RPV1-like [Eucalyptus grandis]|nr:disease resistance protein RPV1-like [Eucalyptus grandis]